MKLKKRILITMMIIISINLLAVVMYGGIYYKKTKDSLIDHEYRDSLYAIQKYIEKEVAELDRLLYDYAKWTDTYDSLESKDHDWIEENIEFLYDDDNYSVDFLYLKHDENGYENIMLEGPNGEFFESSIYKRVRQSDEYINGFHYMNEELYLISAGRIQDNDEARSNGVFFVGKKVEMPYIKDIEETLVELTEVYIDKKHTIQTPYIYDKESCVLEFEYPLKEDSGAVNAYVHVEKDLSDTIGKVDQNMMSLVLMGGLFYVTTFAAVYFYIGKSTREIELIIDDIDYIAKGNYKARVKHGKSQDIRKLKNHINNLADSVENKIRQMEEINIETIQLLINAIEAKDKYTKGHSERVAHYAVKIGEVLEYRELNNLSICGALHDIGKIGIEEEILNKPGRLSDQEFEIIKSHPEKGFIILDGSRLFRWIKDGVLYHHERFDGNGYPKGLRGELIPLSARILAVADTYDAMTSNRSYRKAMSRKKATSIIREESGKQFDPIVVEAFLQVISDEE